jgi:two-component system phosphate regulon response regulator PhoB
VAKTFASILVVEDEPEIRALVTRALSKAGFNTIDAGNTHQAHNIIDSIRPDLIVLDWMLPGQSGFDFLRQLKSDPVYRDLPVILLTARSDESDRVDGLNAGVDDYIVKPFSSSELVARVRAVLRRTAPSIATATVETADIRLDSESRRVTVLGRAVPLGPTEFRLLYFLMTHPERVYSRSQLIQLVWGDNVYIEDRTVDVHVRRLRKALEATGHDRLIQTIRGSGYRFSDAADGDREP